LSGSSAIDFTVIVVTYNRAATLRNTLTAFEELSGRATWELLVVDNGSTDTTRQVVAGAAERLPVSVRYQYDPTPGKYAALNGGIRTANGKFIAATDDDALPREDWLDRALDGFKRFECGFVGGPVFPVWCGARPRWLAEKSSLAGKVLALQDYGSETREYGDGIAWPLGVNVAYRREVFNRAGLFNDKLGRVAGTLRNQAQREWHLRARAAGIRGFYLPDMAVRHAVPGERLTKQYFRRWFFWHGVSRALMYRHAGLDILDPDSGKASATAPGFAAVPLSVWRTMAWSGASWIRRIARGRPTRAFEYELSVAFCAGVVCQRWRDRLAHAATPVASDEALVFNSQADGACLRARLTRFGRTAR
jgi:glycosyltransferase involved in cell wall biosynthesis